MSQPKIVCNTQYVSRIVNIKSNNFEKQKKLKSTKYYGFESSVRLILNCLFILFIAILFVDALTLHLSVTLCGHVSLINEKFLCLRNSFVHCSQQVAFMLHLILGFAVCLMRSINIDRLHLQ